MRGSVIERMAMRCATFDGAKVLAGASLDTQGVEMGTPAWRRALRERM
ncbi:MAG TPA: hypothetical protein VGK32_03370 [Vicinamibacterales bacterium]|jgi:hypothetical protein